VLKEEYASGHFLVYDGLYALGALILSPEVVLVIVAFGSEQKSNHKECIGVGIFISCPVLGLI